MIFDTFDKLDLYMKDLPALRVIADFLAARPLDTLEPGRYDLEEGVYVMISDSATKEGGAFESHRRYLDLQAPIDGDELIDCLPLGCVTPIDEYNPEKDIQFHNGTEETMLRLPMLPGRFAVLYPQDAHRPCQKRTVGTVRKAVFKIPFEG